MTAFRGRALEDLEPIGEQIDHVDVVIDDHRALVVSFRVPTDRSRCEYALFDVEVRGGLVEEVQISLPREAGSNGDALALTAGEVCEILLHDPLKLQRAGDLGVPIRGAEVVRDRAQEGVDAHRSIDLDVLRFIGDVEAGVEAPLVGLKSAGEHLGEC